MELKEIPNYRNYLISKCGRVFSKRKYKCFLKELIQIHDSDGYPFVKLSNKGKIKKFFIHRLVLETYVGQLPKGFVCCHNDGNKLNNNLENLRYDTIANNNKDKVKHGTSKWSKLIKDK